MFLRCFKAFASFSYVRAVCIQSQGSMLHQVKPDDALKAAREAVVPWLMELIEDGYRRIAGSF